MGIVETAVIGVGLAMDAVAVAVTNGMAYRRLPGRDYVAMPFLFGIFQGAMPIAGYFAGILLASIIIKYSGIVICLILSLIGGNMIREGLQNGEAASVEKRLTMRILILQAFATSIDAFAVGVAFCAVQADILPAACLITVITAVMVAVALLIGQRFGEALGNRAELAGGLILVIIGLKAL
ncbi:manganese efflux pump MntP family protein [Ihubacter sp. rT4E-8]|uniref:manganese efflux pump MntP n=1 Tax=unclassified Ihubacter TaxID=2633299 RepID=UPI00137A1871